MPKSCLRIPTPPMTPGGDCSHPRKCVAFSAEDLERIYIADEWDRTPTEVAQKLSYGDVLELKAIQRSLPTAHQLPDPLARRPQSQYLKNVPIGLLPLYDDSLPCNSVSKPGPPPELPPVPSRSPNFAKFTPIIPSSLSSTPVSASPTLSPSRSTPGTPKGQFPPRPKPTFAFLPLLDTPTPPSPPPPPPSSEVDTDDSDHDLSTPALSSASLDTTPSPREHSDSEATSYFQLSTRRSAPSSNPYFPSSPPTYKGASATNSSLLTPSPFSLYAPNPMGHSKSAGSKKPPPPRPAHMESPLRLDINGETFHYGPPSTPPDSPPSSPLSPRLQSPAASSPQNYSPRFPFDHERGQDLPPSLSRSTPRNQGPQKSLPRTRDFHQPSPVPAPYCMSMKRGTTGSGSPCSSPVLGPARGGSIGSRKGRLEH